MKNKLIILILLMLFSFALWGQSDNTIDKGTGILYFSGVPGTVPDTTNFGSEMAIDTRNKQFYFFNRDSAKWKIVSGVQQGLGAPTTYVSGQEKTYLDLSTGRIYRREASAWVELGSGGGGSYDDTDLRDSLGDHRTEIDANAASIAVDDDQSASNEVQTISRTAQSIGLNLGGGSVLDSMGLHKIESVNDTTFRVLDQFGNVVFQKSFNVSAGGGSSYNDQELRDSLGQHRTAIDVNSAGVLENEFNIPKNTDPLDYVIANEDLFYFYDDDDDLKKVIPFDSLLFRVADSLGCEFSGGIDTIFKNFTGDIQFNGGRDPLPQTHNFIFSGVNPTYKNIASSTDLGGGDLRFNSNPPTKAGAQTVQTSSGNGTYIEHTYSGNDNNGYMGLSVDGTNEGRLFGEMDYGIRWCIPSNGGNPNELFAHENGVGGFIGVTITANDVIRIEITDGVVVAKKNGVVVHTFVEIPFVQVTAGTVGFDCSRENITKSAFRDNNNEITNDVNDDVKRNGSMGLGVGADTSRALLHLRKDPTAVSILPTILANNGTMVLVENNMQTSGGFDGIGLVSYNNSCNHIHFGDNDDAAMGEFAYNHPTDELSIVMGDTPLGTGSGAAWGRKPFRWNMNLLGQIYHGQKISDAVLAEYSAHYTIDMTDTYNSDTTFSGLRIINDYDNEKMDLSFGLNGQFKINSSSIQSNYNNNWSSDLIFLVRDATIGEDLNSNFSNLWEGLRIEGDNEKVVINGVCEISDLLQIQVRTAASVENTSPPDGTIVITNDVGTVAPFTNGAGFYVRIAGAWEEK